MAEELSGALVELFRRALVASIKTEFQKEQCPELYQDAPEHIKDAFQVLGSFLVSASMRPDNAGRGYVPEEQRLAQKVLGLEGSLKAILKMVEPDGLDMEPKAFFGSLNLVVDYMQAAAHQG